MSRVGHRYYIVLILSLLAASVAVAQPSHYAVSLAGGKVIPINGSRYEGFTPEAGIAVQALWQHDDQHYWTRYWSQPMMGIHASYNHLYDGLVGDRIELAATTQGPIWRNLSYCLFYGLSLYTNPYRRSHIEENGFIGSYLNCLLSAGVMYEVPLRSGSALFADFRIVHSSNGNIYRPNHGLNLLQADVGYRFAVPRRGPMADTVATLVDGAAWLLTDRSEFRPSLRPFLSVAPSFVSSRTGEVSDHTLYFAYALQVGALRHFHPCWSYGANLDMMYNYSHDRYRLHGEPRPYFGLSAFAESHWGRLTMRLGAGHYLDHYRQNWEQWYIRMGGYWNLTRHHRLGVAMKLHYDHIDFIEWTYMFEF